MNMQQLGGIATDQGKVICKVYQGASKTSLCSLELSEAAPNAYYLANAAASLEVLMVSVGTTPSGSVRAASPNDCLCNCGFDTTSAACWRAACKGQAANCGKRSRCHVETRLP